jgi:hypothetical protein
MLGILVLGGLAAMAYGMLKAFAGSMSDAPELGEKYGKSGCIIALCGLSLTVVSIVLMVI